MTSRDDAITAAGQVLAHGLAQLDSTPPRQAAEAAWLPGGPTIEELEDRIRAMRGLQLRPHAA